MLTEANPRKTTISSKNRESKKEEIPLYFQIVYSNVLELENP